MTARRGPRPAPERLRRLLVMLPWVMERGEVPLAEVARQFQLSEKEVTQDLELVSMCGLPPYVDELVDVFIDEGVVFAGVPRLFDRPFRLSAPEGFALLVAGRAAMQLPGAERGGALDRALTKLAAALGDDGATVVDLERPALLDDLDAAAAIGERCVMRYYTPARDEVSDRQVVVRQVGQVRGRWYVLADDERSGEQRVFRVDRIEHLQRTGERGPERVVSRTLDDSWFDDADLPEVTLVVDADGAWVADAHPVREVEVLADGGRRMRLAVASPAWLAALLVQLGPHLREVAPPSWRDEAAARARAVLARYDAAGS